MTGSMSKFAFSMYGYVPSASLSSLEFESHTITKSYVAIQQKCIQVQ